MTDDDQTLYNADDDLWARVRGVKREHRHFGPVSDERVAELRAMPYDDYLASPEWQGTRKAELAEAHHRCSRCGRHDDVMHVHHRTYQNLGRELPGDLEVLCPGCHADEHGI